MATIFVNGCFDLLHEGHKRFLTMARFLGCDIPPQGTAMPRHGRSSPALTWRNRLIVAINSDRYARKLKRAKWGEKYPINTLKTRMIKLHDYSDTVWAFDNEHDLHRLIEMYTPCILCKGPDYAGRESKVTGSDIAPVLILDTPETEEIREFKRKAYML